MRNLQISVIIFSFKNPRWYDPFFELYDTFVHFPHVNGHNVRWLFGLARKLIVEQMVIICA